MIVKIANRKEFEAIPQLDTNGASKAFFEETIIDRMLMSDMEI
jgi:hypothetical protein